MSEEAVRANLKALVVAVSDVGQVHDYERWSSTWDVFLDKFKSSVGGNTVIRGWTISLTQAPIDTPPYDDEPANKMFTVTYTYTLRGYFGVRDADATEKSALAIVRAVMRALIAGADTLGNVVLHVPMPQLETFDYRLIGGTLVHYAEISQPVECLVKTSEL